jgi:hypothetical protein
MKKNVIKICTLFLFLSITVVSVQAQIISKKAKVINQKVQVVSKASSLMDPVITSPLAGSEINGPFVLVGKAAPNSTVYLSVIPTNKYPENKTGRPRLLQGAAPYKEQNFTITVNAKGLWQSEMIEVKFNTDATDKKIQVYALQEDGMLRSKKRMIEYKTPGMIMIMAPAKITSAFSIKSPVDGSIVKEDSRISGTANPGAVVKVMIFSGYNPADGTGPRAGEKQQLYATADKNGKWETDVANFNIITQAYSNSGYSIDATIENSSEKKSIKVIHPAESSVATSAFRVTSHRATNMVANGTFKIRGVAREGSKILIERTYSGTSTYKYDAPFPTPDQIRITKKNNADFGTLNATADQNGEWWVNCNLKRVTEGATSDDTTTVQATTLTVKISIVDDNGKKLKTETLTFLWSMK